MRWLILLVLMFGWGASYVQRVALSVVVPVLRGDLNLTSVQVGWLFSTFAFALMAGYILMTVFTMLLGTRWGLVIAFVGVSIGACGSGLASSLTGMIIARAVLGFFTGGLLPAAIQSVREWFPPRLRPLAIGLILATSQAAAALTPPVVVSLYQATGWRTVLAVTGVPTLIAALLFVIAWQPPSPEKTRSVSAAAFAAAGMLAFGLFFSAPITNFTLTWLPTYARDKLNLGFDSVASSSVVVMVAGLCGALLVGLVSWIMMQRGISGSRVRAVLLTVCGLFLLPVALAGSVAKLESLIVLLAVSAMAYQGWSTLLYWSVADVLPARGVVIGAAIGALLVNLSGTLSPVVFGYAIQNSGYDFVFRGLGFAATLAFIGVMLLAWLVRQEPARS